LWVIWAGALAGAALQALIMFRSGPHRDLALQSNAFIPYLENLWVAIRSVFFGNSFGFVLGDELTQEIQFLPGSAAFFGILITAFLLFLKGPSSFLIHGSGLLLVMALVTSVIPSVVIANNLKYFVLFSTLVVAAAVLGLYGQFQGTKGSWLPVTLSVFLMILWAPSFAASSYRTTPNPVWTNELGRIASVCEDDSAAFVQFRFTPNWTDDPSSPSDNSYGVISCTNLIARL
jgi:hypothetical protein